MLGVRISLVGTFGINWSCGKASFMEKQIQVEQFHERSDGNSEYA